MFFVSRLICSILIIHVALGRKHKLVLENDVRKYFSITSFGFFNGGELEVHVNDLSFIDSDTKGDFGLTLTKTVSDGITPYMEGHQNKCALTENTLIEDGNIEIVTFLLRSKSKEVLINCSSLSSSLEIQPGLESNSTKAEEIIKKSPKSDQFQNEPQQIFKQKRSADNGSTSIFPVEQKISVPTEKGVQNELKICTSPKLFYENRVIGTKRQISGLKFIVSIKNHQAEGLYSLFFHNCAGFKDNRELPVPVNLSVSITEKNGDNFLSAGEIPLPHLYFFMSCIFFVTGCVWITVLKRKRDEVYKIHYLMGLLVFIKSLSLLFHGINFNIIAKDGSPMEAWAVLYYITHLLKGALLFITIVLIGTGWAFIKHILSDKDKKIFMIVIPMQVLANVAEIIMEESEVGESKHYTWNEVFILVDLLCCGAILFPVVWSIRHLQEASHTDGKAAINLEKLKLFRHFYIMVVCYIYFTRIIVYLLRITVPFQYEWLDEMFKETATLIFFLLTGYNFRPTSSNPYFRLSQEDFEIEEVLTQTGFTEAATKTIRSRDLSHGDDHSTSTTTTKRESSHEYD